MKDYFEKYLQFIDRNDENEIVQNDFFETLGASEWKALIEEFCANKNSIYYVLQEDVYNDSLEALASIILKLNVPQKRKVSSAINSILLQYIKSTPSEGELTFIIRLIRASGCGAKHQDLKRIVSGNFSANLKREALLTLTTFSNEFDRYYWYELDLSNIKELSIPTLVGLVNENLFNKAFEVYNDHVGLSVQAFEKQLLIHTLYRLVRESFVKSSNELYFLQKMANFQKDKMDFLSQELLRYDFYPVWKKLTLYNSGQEQYVLSDGNYVLWSKEAEENSLSLSIDNREFLNEVEALIES